VRKLIIGAALSLLSSSPTFAQQCQLMKITSYDLVFDDRGRPTILFTIADKQEPMIVDTGAQLSSVSEDTAKILALPRTPMHPIPSYDTRGDVPPYDAYGNKYRFVATAPTIAIGPFADKNADFVVAPTRTDLGTNAGTIGYDILRNFDLDFDFANHRLNLFDSDHCPGKVVYWTAGGATRIPFRLDMMGRPVFSATLEGSGLETVLDTGSQVSHISEPIAEQLFSIDRTSKGTESLTENGNAVFRHRFATLTVGGVTISNPTLYLQRDDLGRRAQQDTQSSLGDLNIVIPHVPQLALGMNELKDLHVFVSNKEKLIYVTAADAH
jgi:predicted aspartyl protease